MYFRKIYGNFSVIKYKLIMNKLNKVKKFRLNYFYFFFELNLLVIFKKLGYNQSFLNLFLKYNAFILLRNNSIYFINRKFFKLKKRDFIFFNFSNLPYSNMPFFIKKKPFLINYIEYSRNIHSFIILNYLLFHNLLYF